MESSTTTFFHFNPSARATQTHPDGYVCEATLEIDGLKIKGFLIVKDSSARTGFSVVCPPNLLPTSTIRKSMLQSEFLEEYARQGFPGMTFADELNP